MSKPEKIYSVAFFRNPAWGQRSSDNRMEFNSLKVYKTLGGLLKSVTKFGLGGVEPTTTKSTMLFQSDCLQAEVLITII